MKFSLEVKTAILIISCIAIFVFGFSYLKGSSLLNNNKQIHTLYDDVEGLVVGSNVTISGLNVGKVTNIDFDKNYEQIKVTFSIRNDLNFSSSSKAMLYEPGLIGGKSIAIIPNYESLNLIKDGDILLSDVKPGLTELVNQQIAPLQDKIEGLLTSADSLFAGVSNVMNYNSQNNLKLALEGITRTIENINSLSQTLSQIVDNNQKVFNSALKNIESTSENLAILTDSISKFPVVSTFKNLEIVSVKLNKIIGRLESGEGSLGKLLNDDAFYSELLHSSEALESLLTDLKNNPKKYLHFSVFGRKENSLDKE